MNAQLANLITPQKALPKPAVGKAPASQRAERPAERVAERANNAPRRAGDDQTAPRQETSSKASQSGCVSDCRTGDRRGSKAEKKSGDSVVLVAQGIDVQQQQETPSGSKGAAATFATILKAAGQTSDTPAANMTKAEAAGQTSDTPVANTAILKAIGQTSDIPAANTTILKAAVQASDTPADNTTKAEAAGSRAAAAVKQTASKDVAAIAEAPLDDSNAKPAKLADILNSATTVPAAKDVLLNASAAAVSAKAQTGKNAAEAGKPAESPIASGVAEAAPIKMAINPHVAVNVKAQKGDVQAPPVQQNAAVTNTTEPLTKPNPAAAVGDRIKISNNLSQQADISEPAARGVSVNRFAVLAQEFDRQGQVAVKTSAPRAVNSIVGQADSPAIETATVQAASSNPAEAASAVRQVSEALEASAARNGQEIVIRLDPAHLGKVCVKLRMDGNEVRGVLDVENPGTLTQLQREAPNIIARLSDAGIEMKRMDVSLSQDGGRDSSWSSQYGQEADTRGQWSAAGGNSTGGDNTLSDQLDSRDEHHPVLATVGGDSINVWI